MHIFSEGIKITNVEYKCLLHVEVNPEAWLLALIMEKARLRRDALIKEWQPRLFADPTVTELPADDEGLCNLIMARDDYKTRLQQDVAQDPSAVPDRYNITFFEDTLRTETITLFPLGIDLTDMDYHCILAYVQDLENWIIGALIGHINRGKKKMIEAWQPIILADSSVTTMPATEDGLINMIVERDDYKT